MLNKFQILKNGLSFQKKKQTQQNIKNDTQEFPFIQFDIEYINQLSDKHDNKNVRKLTNILRDEFKKNRILTKGNRINIPCPSMQYLIKKSNLDNEIIQCLQQQFNIEQPTWVQAFAFVNIGQKRNYLSIAPTGSGKTLAFLVPLLNQWLQDQSQKILIIAPTFEISVQIYKVALKLRKNIKKLQSLNISHLSNIKNNVKDNHIIISAPKTFLNLYKKESQDFEDFRNIVLDEADKYFELSFQDQLKEILEIFKVNQKTYYMFSATYPTQIEKQLEQIFIDKIEIIVGGKVRVLSSIEQKLIFCSNEEGKVFELEDLLSSGKIKMPCLIFLQNKDRVSEIYYQLKNKIKYVDYLDSKISLLQRDQKVKKFMAGQIWILITTDVLARGIDFPQLKTVINYDMPTSIINYIHRVGRTGRANKIGQAYTFYTIEDKQMLRKLADLLKSSNVDIPQWIFSIQKKSKKYFKKLEKNPTKRESILRHKRIKKDKEFYADIKKRDYQYYKKQNQQSQQSQSIEEEEQWQTAGPNTELDIQYQLIFLKIQMKKIITKLYILFFIVNLYSQSKIQTISMGANHKYVTTGNGSVQNVDYRTISVPIKTIEYAQYKDQLKYIQQYEDIKNSLIFDFPSEDPKVFRPQLSDYWYVSSKRGFIFNFLAICSLLFIFWVFILRIALGECGGYKSIIRKPKKSLRHQKIRIIIFGCIIFGSTICTSLYFAGRDYEDNKNLGNILVNRNQVQLDSLYSSNKLSQGVIQILQEINNKKLEVLYAENSFEKFQVGIFLNPLIDTYKKSIQQSIQYNESFFTGMKSQIQLRLILMVIIVFSLCGYFIYVYNRRKVLHSLGITLGLFFMIFFAFNTLNTQFNIFSVQIEMCKETLQIFNQKKGFLFQQNNEIFNSMITSLNADEKKILRTQMLSVLIGQNSIIQMLKQFIVENTNEKEKLLETTPIILKNYNNLLTIFQNTTNENTYSYELLKEYLETFKELTQVFRTLGDLSEGNSLKKFALQANQQLCQHDIDYQYYSMWALFGAIIGIFIIASGIYLSENVIRGIYNEEIKYVKTNKLRYDWN